MIDLNETLILSVLSSIEPVTKLKLAESAVIVYGSSSKFSRPLALAIIDQLEASHLIDEDKKKKLTLSFEGHQAILGVIPLIEKLRALVAGARYNFVKR